MSSISGTFRFDDAADSIWTICVAIGLSIVIAIISLLVLALQHLYCIPESAIVSKSQPKNIKIYATMAVIFAALSAIVTFSMYLVCTCWICGESALGFVYNIFFWSFYSLAKIFLYLIFIGRLFNAHYARIYQYPIFIQYVLWMLLIVLVMDIAPIDFTAGLLLGGLDYPDTIDYFCGVLYSVIDILISVFTTLLFFKPICWHGVRNTGSENVAKRYCIISALQLIAAVSYQLTLMGGMYLYARHVSGIVVKEYKDIIHVIQMLDCLLLIICIYAGFARKRVVCLQIIWESSFFTHE